MVSTTNQLYFFFFRENLSSQMLMYSPQNLVYPGDEKMLVVTSMSKSACIKRTRGPDSISLGQFRAAKRTMSSRLCGDLEKLCHHIKLAKRMNKPRICVWCGVPIYSACGVYVDRNNKPIPLHYNSKKGKGKYLICFYQYHNDDCFGLGKNDSTHLLNGVKNEWVVPDNRDIRDNTNYIKKLN